MRWSSSIRSWWMISNFLNCSATIFFFPSRVHMSSVFFSRRRVIREIFIVKTEINIPVHLHLPMNFVRDERLHRKTSASYRIRNDLKNQLPYILNTTYSSDHFDSDIYITKIGNILQIKIIKNNKEKVKITRNKMELCGVKCLCGLGWKVEPQLKCIVREDIEQVSYD